MEPLPRHQCLIYEGAPSRQLPSLAARAVEKLGQNYRCLYLNSAPMVAGMRSYLAAAGVDVAHEVEKASLVLSSEQGHLAAGQFDVKRMIRTIEEAIQQALDDGFDGLWATGDMTWELGPERDRWRLLEYEWRLEKLFRTHPQLSGICQYHADTLPRDLMRQGLLGHQSIFVSETLSLLNPYYVLPEAFTLGAAENTELDSAVSHLCKQGQLSSPVSS
jgi:hypothetical protein